MNNYTIINYDKNYRYGIYKITNLLNGKVYIGQSINIRVRIWQHVNYEVNVHLKNSFDKYGIENFQFEVIKVTKDLDYWEKFFIYWYRSTDSKYGYNIAEGGNTSPFKNEEVREKLRKSLTSFYRSKRGKEINKKKGEKIRKSMNNWSDEYKQELINNVISKIKKIYVLCINRKIVKYLKQWKHEEGKEITLRQKNHLFKLYGRYIIRCKGEYFVSFENKIPTSNEIEMYYDKLEYIDKTWHELRNNKIKESSSLKFKFKCIETDIIYDYTEIEKCKKDNNIKSNNIVTVKMEIKKCCDGKKETYHRLHYKYV